MKTFTCSGCKKEIKRTSNYQEYCASCARKRHAKRTKMYRKSPNGKTAVDAYIKSLRGKEIRAKNQRSLGVKHYRLKEVLIKEQVSKTDLLWRLNFYKEIIADGVCHYCLGALSPLGHNLDRVNNGLGHVCYNVVPCCAGCNTIKGHRLSYKEMTLLVPALREIRRLRATV